MATLVPNIDPNTPRLAGSIFINNTSYSGVDIKVVVNVYNQGKDFRDQLALMDQQIREDEVTLQRLTDEAEQLLQELQTLKQSTPSFLPKTTRRRRLLEEIANLTKSIESASARVKKLRERGVIATTKVLAEAQTLSLSTHRDKVAVRACGSVYPKGFTRGPREIAGSMIFTVFNEHVLYRFLEAHSSDFDASVGLTSAIMDQLPPVDITIAFANEYGQLSRMTIRGVEFVNEGQTMSIEDIITENVVQFVARDYDPMRAVGQREVDENSLLMSNIQPKRASDLLLEEDYLAVKEHLDPYERFSRRRNPFL